MFDRPSVLGAVGVLMAISIGALVGYGGWNLRNQSTDMGTGNEKASPNGAFVASASTMWRESSARGIEETWYQFSIVRKETGHTMVTRPIDVPRHIRSVDFRVEGMIIWAPDSSQVTFTDGTNPICTLVVPQKK